MALLWVGASAGYAGGCPDPRTCDLHAYTTDRVWPTAADGLVHIEYWVNPTQPWIPSEDAVEAVREAFHTWEAAVPRLRFEFQGTTARPPIALDRYNVVGWLAVPPPFAAFAFTNSDEEHVLEGDVILGLQYPWYRYACEQRNGSCTTLDRDFFADWTPTKDVWPFDGSSGAVRAFDVQNVVTHEIGHWLGLDDLPEADASELTMGPGGESIDRKRVTLGLGDVLGARGRYPCGCPLPTLFVP